MTLHINSSEGHYLNVSLPKEIQISSKYGLPIEPCQLCHELGICVCFFSALTCDQTIQQGYEIVKKIKVDGDGNDLKSVQYFAIDVL